MCWGRGPSHERNTLSHSPHSLPISKKTSRRARFPRATQFSTVFPPVRLIISVGGGVRWGHQMNVTEVLARLLRGWGRTSGPRPGAHRPHRASLEAQPPPRGRAQRAELCAPASREEAANLQIPTQTRRLPSARKVLLIKLVHLITGRAIKYFSRCFRCSLWALVKAGEASDQGCWPCGAGARCPLAWTRLAPRTTIRPGSFAVRLAEAQSVITKVKKHPCN